MIIPYLINNIYITKIKNITVGYLSPIILIVKKQLNRWGMNPLFHFKTMSNNSYYVNLMSNQPIKHLKVGNRPYFVQLFQKISRCTPSPAIATPRIPKIQKTLPLQGFKRFSLSTMCRKSNDVVILLIRRGMRGAINKMATSATFRGFTEPFSLRWLRSSKKRADFIQTRNSEAVLRMKRMPGGRVGAGVRSLRISRFRYA